MKQKGVHCYVQYPEGCRHGGLSRGGQGLHGTEPLRRPRPLFHPQRGGAHRRPGQHRHRRGARRPEDHQGAGGCEAPGGGHQRGRLQDDPAQDQRVALRQHQGRRAGTADLRPAHRRPRGHRRGDPPAGSAGPVPGGAHGRPAGRRHPAGAGALPELPVLRGRPEEDRPALLLRAGLRLRLVPPAPRGGPHPRRHRGPGKGHLRQVRL